MSLVKKTRNKLTAVILGAMAVTGLGGTTVFAQDPQLVEAEAPDYPRAAQRRQIQGYEIVKYAINSHGSVGEVEVVESVPEGILTARLSVL